MSNADRTGAVLERRRRIAALIFEQELAHTQLLSQPFGINDRRVADGPIVTYRARLKPVIPRPLPLGATATLVVQRAAGEAGVAPIPAAAMTQSKGRPAVWVVRRAGPEPVGAVELAEVAVHGYGNDEVLVSGLPAGELVITAGVQKMAPGLRVALPGAAASVASKQAAR